MGSDRSPGLWEPTKAGQCLWKERRPGKTAGGGCFLQVRQPASSLRAWELLCLS